MSDGILHFFPPAKRPGVPPDHWILTGHFRADEYFRERGPKQEAIRKFLQQGGKFLGEDDCYDRKLPEHFFVDGTKECYPPPGEGGGKKVVPCVWFICELHESLERYTNPRASGPGKKYDELFSFEIKLRYPDLPQISSIIVWRDLMRDSVNLERPLFRGLSPWEKELKLRERRFIEAAPSMDDAVLKKKAQAFSMIDSEFHCLGTLITAREFPIRLSQEHAERVERALWSLEDDTFQRSRRFNHVLNEAYSSLIRDEECVESLGGALRADRFLQESLLGRSVSELSHSDLQKIRTRLKPVDAFLEMLAGTELNP